MDDDPPVTVCPGDSGGPLIARNSKGPVVVAITSYGPNICGEVPIINMGTSVSYWRDFLEEILSFNNLRGLYSPSKSNTLENNRCYQGPIIGKLTTSAWRCAEKCRAASSCSAWTHSYTTRRCVLFRSANRYYMDENCTSGYFE
jgi:secreted trypsin-like serine protease